MAAPPLANLINELSRLPGIGSRSAQRLAYSILRKPRADAEALAHAILEVREKIVRCSRCNNLTDVDPCSYCTDARRDQTILCVVEEAWDIASIEAASEFHGLYHVLLGALSPLKGIGPGDIDVAGVVSRVRDGEVREVIVATNPNVEGEATAHHLAAELRAAEVKVTRLAFGLPVGGDLEYADHVTMSRALSGRREM
ncbi:MAG: recombination mediator RecR [Acidobacteria bacterium]|nr:recombination mediator RecR [Acidobacteriota bacterium]